MNSFNTRFYGVTFASVCVLALAGCAFKGSTSESPGPAAQATGLNAQQNRITDERILADRRTIDALQTKLRKLNESGVAQNSYALGKAQCWLDTAKTQYHENDRTGYIEESLAEAAKIAQALEADKNAKVGLDTPLVARSSKLREDLWAQLNSLKNDPVTVACSARTVACAEVRLVRAGHADQQTGWRQATPHVQMVEDALRQVKREADACAVPKVAAQGAAPSSPSAPAPPAVAVSRETYVLLTDTLFRFNKATVKDMTPGGLQRLDDVAKRLKSYSSIQSLNIVGFTDRLGSDAYNNALSLARAKTVQAYLESLGVKAGSASAKGKGKSEPVSQACPPKASRAQLIQCLQPDRRVTIEVTGITR